MEDSQKLLSMLVEQEEKAAQLYHAYQEKFPQEPIWSQLVKDESNHGSWLRALATDPKAVFDMTRFSTAAVQSILDYQDKIVQEVPSHNLITALSVSYDLETALIEKSFFENFETDSADLQKILNDLANETKRHRMTIKNRLDEARKTERG